MTSTIHLLPSLQMFMTEGTRNVPGPDGFAGLQIGFHDRTEDFTGSLVEVAEAQGLFSECDHSPGSTGLSSKRYRRKRGLA